MKLNKMVLAGVATALLVSAIALPVSAHSNDTEYSIDITSSYSGLTFDGQFQNSYSQWEKKDNNTSSYVKAESGLSSFIAVIWGGWANTDNLCDCTTYEIYSGLPRTPAVVRVGQKGYVRQDVYERFGVRAAAQIFAKYNGVTGTAEGVWSPDSVPESNCVEFN